MKFITENDALVYEEIVNALDSTIAAMGEMELTNEAVDNIIIDINKVIEPAKVQAKDTDGQLLLLVGVKATPFETDEPTELTLQFVWAEINEAVEITESEEETI